MWSDNETTQDFLGFKIHAELLESVITDKSLLPITIGVFGDWGSGKSSIMKMIEYNLNPENFSAESCSQKLEKVACLYFNGWLFEGYDDAKAAILTSIILQLGEHKRFGPKIRDKAASLLKTINWMRVTKLGIQHIAAPAIAAYVSGGASAIPMLAANLMSNAGLGGNKKDVDSSTPEVDNTKINWSELIKKDDKESGPLDVRTFRERFSKLLKDSDIETLVVLIDDLDRCSPARIVENLEAIKLFLNVENTAFVIGADPRIVRHAISVQFKEMRLHSETKDDLSDRLVVDYLEKLVQVPYHLPRLSPSEIETYMCLLFCSKELSKENMSPLLQAFEQQRSQNHYSSFGYGAIKACSKSEILTKKLTENLSFCSRSANLIAEGLKGNPRQVKRFLNAFIMRQKLAAVAKLTHIDETLLVKLMILEYGQPDAFRQIYDWQSKQEGHPQEIKSLEQAAKSSDENDLPVALKNLNLNYSPSFMKKWLSMEPFLSGTDLRDYFWIARDRLESTFSGITFVSPIVRRLLEDLIGSNQGRRSSAVKQALSLDSEEGQALLESLKRTLLNKPENKMAYDAFRALIENDFLKSLEMFISSFEDIPEDKIPAAVGMDLVNLAKGKANTAASLQPLIQKLKVSKSRVGVALGKAK